MPNASGRPEKRSVIKMCALDRLADCPSATPSEFHGRAFHLTDLERLTRYFSYDLRAAPRTPTSVLLPTNRTEDGKQLLRIAGYATAWIVSVLPVIQEQS